ncbi:hypothetical protein [Candidatus Cytomitobacter primus]|uniref:HemY N-terminal domain-containing protein n=1 Tax=Candidatus Cytomitobacter primus TaxID=2066024 RepID=A0A5C0UEF0_9PROT|nr:hypothetical protein [Candidatus Cytomitobacter primus]QEK38466.1 hypothetical protein FZC34_00850 [Candidatus Cytomitobacter primus]
MISKIIYIISVAIIMKISDIVPFQLKIGDICYSGQLSILLLYAAIAIFILLYFYNISNHFKRYYNKFIQYRRNKYEKHVNQKLIIESAKQICKNLKIIDIAHNHTVNCNAHYQYSNVNINHYNKSNIMHHLVLFMHNPNLQSAKQLDKYTEGLIFSSIFFACQYLSIKNYGKAQNHLKYLQNKISNRQWIYDNLFTCYLKNAEFYEYEILLNNLYKQNIIQKEYFESKHAILLLEKFNAGENEKDLEKAFNTYPNNIIIGQKYIQMFTAHNEKSIAAIEKIWNYHASFDLALDYYHRLTALSSHKLEKIQMLIKKFPNHQSSIYIQCYAAIEARAFHISDTLINLVQDTRIKKLLQIKINIAKEFNHDYIQTKVEQVIQNTKIENSVQNQQNARDTK